MVATKKAIGFLFLFVSVFLLGIALAADDSSKLLQINSYEYDVKMARVQNDILSGEDEEDRAKWNSVIILEIDSWSLGIETAGGIMTRLIPMNLEAPIKKSPTKKSRTFTTYEDHQTSVLIKVYQGEGWLTKDCRELGRFNLSGIPPAPMGVPQIEVTFEVTFDVDGYKNLQVRAEDKASKKSESITIPDCDHRKRSK